MHVGKLDILLLSCLVIIGRNLESCINVQYTTIISLLYGTRCTARTRASFLLGLCIIDNIIHLRIFVMGLGEQWHSSNFLDNENMPVNKIAGRVSVPPSQSGYSVGMMTIAAGPDP